MNATRRYRPTSDHASSAKLMAKLLGLKVRIARKGWSLRLIGSPRDVSVLVLAEGFTGPSGSDLMFDRSAESVEVFAYITE